MGRQIKTIAHLSDIHIRKLHRLKEYREVFDRLYEQLRKLKPDLIYVGGDIVHGKLDTSPEEIRLVSSFFLNLSSITDTIVITGNHDVNLQNKSREDALSPIVDLVQQITDKLHYWKQSGVYTIGNVDFSLLSVFDMDQSGQPVIDNFTPASKLNNDYKIALHHGSVDNFTVDTGLVMENTRIRTGLFDGFDITMLGDIHKRQYLNDDETIAYCGSLIQQGFAEDPSKGFLLWDLESKSAEFVQVENNYGFKTIELVDGVLQNTLKFVPPLGNVRIKYWNTTLEQIKDLQIELRKKYPNLKEIKAEKQDTLSGEKGLRLNKIDVGDVRDLKFQNTLIEEFLKNKIETIDDDTIKRIFKINELTNNTPEIYNDSVVRNVSWKLKSFEFDNMFSYKEGNKVDFSGLDGVVGLVAPNHSGKSAMLDSIAYTIFDNCSRTYKALDVLNKRKETFSAKLNIEINGSDYWIERRGELKIRRHKNNKVSTMCPVAVKFYMIDDAGEKVDLTGAARRNSQYGSGTNEEIRKILGTFDDFILTSLSLQQHGTEFIEKKQSERKQVLSQFMDMDVFDKLYDIAKEDSNEERVLLRRLMKRDSYTDLVAIEKHLQVHQDSEEKISTQIDDLDLIISDLEATKIAAIKQLWKIEEWEGNPSDLSAELSKKKKELEQLEDRLTQDQQYKETLRPLYLKYHEKMNLLDEDTINANYQLHIDSSKELENKKGKLEAIQQDIASRHSTLQELEKYQYDQECKFCISNGGEHIKHKQTIKKYLHELNTKKVSLETNTKDISTKLSGLKISTEQKNEYDRLTDELNQISQDAIKIGGKLTTMRERINHLKTQIKEIDAKIQTYYQHEEKIKTNKKINQQLVSIDKKISKWTSMKDTLTVEYENAHNALIVAKKEKEDIEADIKRLVSIEQKLMDYDMYMLAMSRDGISYELISKTIPSIESEINEVLDNMMVGFTIKLVMDGKNIDTLICYGEKEWSLDLASGMERFVSNLAIRVGLINVSTLPRPNFLCIDEGFGTLDGESIVNIEGAFNYLKTQFDFVLIITHLDAIKDFVDHLIPIDVSDGFSQIVHA